MCVYELRGHGGVFKEASPTVRVLHHAVVLRLKVLLADKQLDEDVKGCVYVHVQSTQPLPQPLWVAEWEPVKGDVRPLDVVAAIDAAFVHHSCC